MARLLQAIASLFTLFTRMCFSIPWHPPFANRKTRIYTRLSANFRLGLLAIVAGLFLLGNPPAWAVSLSQDGAGGRAAGMGGVGTSVANDPLSALFNNPAALADLGTRPMVQAGGDLGVLGGSFYNRVNGDANLSTVAGIGQFAASVPVGPFSFGIGVNPDIAARVSGHYDDAPGGADGATSYGNTRNTSELLLLRSAVGAGYRIAPDCFVGLTVGLLYNVNELRTNYVFQSQPVLRTVKTGLDLNTDGFGYNFQAGFRWRPVQTVSLNISYTSRSQVRSHGSATGNAGVQLTNLGLGAARHDFEYDAEVTNDFPQMVNAGVAWLPPMVKGLTVSGQFDWINWSQAFDDLPVHLTNGNNANLNGLVGSRTLNDDVPLRWRDSYVGRFGAEQVFGQHWAVRLGYAYGSHPTPSNTLTPLTAALPEHLPTGGLGYHTGRWRVDAAYQWQIPATDRVKRSALAAGEYSNSVTEVHTQLVNVTAAVSF